jgi:uncharacterized protein
MDHPVVWFEIMGNDAAKLHGFYNELFRWPLKQIDFPGYALMENVEAGIPGGVGDKNTMKGHPGVTFYVSCKNLDETLDRAKQLGAKIPVPRFDLPDGLSLAMIEDPQGNRIGVLQARK